MTKPTFSRFFFALTGVLITIIGLNLSKTALAQTIEGSGLETQISRLTETLEKIFVKEKDGGQTDPALPPVVRAVRIVGTPAPDCFRDLQAGRKSHQYKAGLPWDILFIPYSNSSRDELNRRELFTDLNGDGLIDYLFLKTNVSGSFGGSSRSKNACVYLNNGHGLTPAYRCSAVWYVDSIVPTPPTYRYSGDCADPAGYFDE